MSAAEIPFSSELSIEYERQFIKVAQLWADEFVRALGAPSEITFKLSLLIECHCVGYRWLTWGTLGVRSLAHAAK